MARPHLASVARPLRSRGSDPQRNSASHTGDRGPGTGTLTDPEVSTVSTRPSFRFAKALAVKTLAKMPGRQMLEARTSDTLVGLRVGAGSGLGLIYQREAPL